MNLFILLRIMLAFILITPPVLAKCFLPIPDGGDDGYSPSMVNLYGDIVKVGMPFVFVKNGETKQVEKVSISKITEIYSVYGGDSPLSDLKPGMQVWIWFHNCTKPKVGVPDAAYFQFFSTDPKDRAKLNSNGKIIAVPK